MHLYVLLDVKFEDASGRMVDVDKAFFLSAKGCIKGLLCRKSRLVKLFFNFLKYLSYLML